MTIPDFQTLMLPILNETVDKQDHSISEVIEKVAKVFNLSDEERTEILPSGQQYRFDNRVHWAITYLSKAGLVERTGRGRFRITEAGIKAINEKPLKIDKVFLSRYEGYMEFRKRKNLDIPSSIEEGGT